MLAGDFANTGELLDAAAAAYGDREAFVAGGSRISFVEWASRSRSVAAGLAAHGVRKGDVVALRLPSGIDYATCYAAAAMIGAVTTGINPRLGPRETEAILEHAQPAVVISEPVEVQRLSGHRGGRRGAVPDAEIDRADPVALIFSSGTTGLPKGAVFDGNNLLAGARSAGIMSAPNDRRLTSTPFAHAGYMFKLWDQLLWGTTLVIPPTPWTADGMALLLREEKITVAGAVPTQWAKLLEVCTPEALPHLRVGVVATAPASGIGERPTGSPVSSIVSRMAAIRAAASSAASGSIAASAWSPGSMRPPGKTSAPPANAIALARSTISNSGAPPSTSRKMTTVAAGIASCIVPI